MATPSARTEAARPRKDGGLRNIPFTAPEPRPRLAFVACPFDWESALLPVIEGELGVDCRSIDDAPGTSTLDFRPHEAAVVFDSLASPALLASLRAPCLVVGHSIPHERAIELLSLGVQHVYDLSELSLGRVAQLLAAHAVGYFQRSRDRQADTQGRAPLAEDVSCFAVIEWDKNLRILRWSDEAESLLGIPKNEAEGRALGRWLLPSDESISFISGCQSLANGVLGNHKGSCRVRRSDGVSLEASWKVTPADAEGRAFIAIFETGSPAAQPPPFGLPGAVRLDDLAVAEPRPRRYKSRSPSGTEAGFNQRAAFLASAVEQLSIGVYLKEERGTSAFTVWNAQMERLFHIEKKDVLGKRLEEVFKDTLLRSMLGEAKPPHSRSRAIVPRSRAHGDPGGNFIADVTKTPIFNEEGEVTAIIGIVHDVTERIQSENRLVSAFNELEASKEKLEKSNLEIRKGIEKAKKLAVAAQASNKAKSFFLSNISHELRTPLTSIVSLTHALLEGTFGPMNPKQKEYLEIVSDSSKHLQALITDILDLSKIELGKLNLKIARTSISEIAQASMRMVMQQAQAKNVKCELQFDSTIDAIDVDPKRLRQVLLNLLFNAVKFTRPDTTIRLTISGSPEEEVAIFKVRDEGIGIQEVDIEKIFTPFTQLDDSLSKQYEGTGLGLAIVSKLVELHGGGLAVRSQADQGAEFSMTLPIEQPPETAREEGQTLAEIVASEPGTSLVLIVEENDRLARQMQGEMVRAGISRSVVAMPNELFAYYDQARPVAIIADLATVSNNGSDWIQAARDHHYWTNTRWIATSSLNIGASRRLSEKLGFDLFVPKPVTTSVLKHLIPSVD